MRKRFARLDFVSCPKPLRMGLHQFCAADGAEGAAGGEGAAGDKGKPPPAASGGDKGGGAGKTGNGETYLTQAQVNDLLAVDRKKLTDRFEARIAELEPRANKSEAL